MIARVKELKYLIFYDSSADSPYHFFTHLILYSPILPLVIFSNLDLATLVHKFFIERKVLEKTPHFLNVLDPFPFTNIAQIQYIFLDKTGTITKTDYKVAEIFFNNQIYRINPEKLSKKLKQMPLTERNRLNKMPFQGVSTSGETMYASMNLNATIFDKSKKFLGKIEEKEENSA